MVKMAHHEECGICHSDGMCEHRLKALNLPEPRPPSICPLCGEVINPLDEIETSAERIAWAVPGCTTTGWVVHKRCVDRRKEGT